MKLIPTASQTVGPYLHIGLCRMITDRIAPADSPGEHFTIKGRVLDADGVGVNDALVEIWQADSHGRYGHPDDPQYAQVTPGFRGFGRIPTDGEGRFNFHTIKPGPVPDFPDGRQAPHLMVSIFMRGLLKHLVTRLYFPDDPLNADDRVLRSVPAERRSTLVARKTGPQELEWDVSLQGAHETVFFDC
jgi:protocatechuate 3,4-dioxygenase alpha subunit